MSAGPRCKSGHYVNVKFVHVQGTHTRTQMASLLLRRYAATPIIYCCVRRASVCLAVFGMQRLDGRGNRCEQFCYRLSFRSPASQSLRRRAIFLLSLNNFNYCGARPTAPRSSITAKQAATLASTALCALANIVDLIGVRIKCIILNIRQFQTSHNDSIEYFWVFWLRCGSRHEHELLCSPPRYNSIYRK